MTPRTPEEIAKTYGWDSMPEMKWQILEIYLKSHSEFQQAILQALDKLNKTTREAATHR